MITLYDSLLETARMDYQAANMLATEHLFAHSIFYFSQTFEKGLKSTYAYYAIKRKNQPENRVESDIKGNFGHKHRKQTVMILNLLLDMDRQRLKKEYEINSIKSLDEAYINLKRLEERHYIRMDELCDFHNIVKVEYNKKYKHLSRIFLKAKERFIVLTWILSRYYDFAECFTRYPLGRFQYMNMRILNSPQMDETCRYFSDMDNEFLQVIPDVWTTLDS